MSQDPVEDVKNNMTANPMAMAGLFMLVVLFVIAMAMFYAAVAAGIATPLLMLASRGLGHAPPLGYGRAYGTGFVGLLAFWCTAVALLLALPDPVTAPLSPWVSEALKQPRDIGLQPSLRDQWSAAALVGLPALAAFALVLTWRLHGAYAGTAGWLRGLLVGVPVVSLSSWGAWQLITLAADRFRTRHLGWSDSFSAALYFLVLTLLVAAAAAAVGSLVLWALHRGVYRERGLPWSALLGPVYRALVACLLVTELVIFLLPNQHPLLLQARLVARSSTFDGLAQALGAIQPGLLLTSLAAVLLPGLMVFAAWLAASLGGVYRGWAGYTRACVSGVAVLSTSAVSLWWLGAGLGRL